MATLDILSHGRVDVGLGRTGYPYQLTPYGSDLQDTRGMWQEFADVLPRIWTQEEISYDGTYYRIPRREVLPKPVQQPHPPLCIGVTCASVTRRGGSASQKAEFRVRMAPVGWTYFSCFRRSGEMGLFLLVVWCSIAVGRHGSRFGDSNFRLGRREFPVRGAAGICRQGLDLLYRLRGPMVALWGKSTKFPFRREKPGISPDPSEERGTSATVAPVIPPLESRCRRASPGRAARGP
jgi:Luciferase-like monooxygenase